MTTVVSSAPSAAPIDVAAEVRAQMARARIRPNHLPRLVGRSQSYWSRRVNGETPFDTEDLITLAVALHVHPARFFGIEGHPPITDPSGPVVNSGWRSRRRGVRKLIRNTRHDLVNAA